MPRRRAAPPPDVEYRAGLQLTGTILRCDAEAGRSLCFLSHVGVRPPPRPQGLLCTDRTLALHRALEPRPAARGDPWSGALAVATCRPFALGPLRLELVPAGSLPGAASLLVSRDDGRRVFYAASASPRLLESEHNVLAEPVQPRACDTLVIEAALPVAARLLPRAEVAGALARFCEQARADGLAAVLLADPRGTAPELAALLVERGLAPVLDARVARWAAAYRTAGVALPALAVRRGAPRAGEILIAAISSHRRLATALPPAARIAVVSGDVDPDRAAAGGAPVPVFPFDHRPDAGALVRFARDCRPREVVVLGLHGAELAAHLLEEGLRARPLGPPQQLSLL